MTGLEASPVLSGALALGLLVALAAVAWRGWPAIVSEAARRALLMGFPLACSVVALTRSQPLAARVAVASAWLAGLSLFSAEGCRANADAGWRRGAGWAGAVLVPPLVVAGLLWWLAASPPRDHRLVTAAGVAVTLLAWAPAMVAESYRVREELSEEVRLGLMPPDDARVLAYPWLRLREPRFGQRDERREYVRSALLLAVAHRQQTRRAGEAARLRQLEVIAFRTRLRRTQEVRAGRLALGTADLPEDEG